MSALFSKHDPDAGAQCSESGSEAVAWCSECGWDARHSAQSVAHCHHRDQNVARMLGTMLECGVEQHYVGHSVPLLGKIVFLLPPLIE